MRISAIFGLNGRTALVTGASGAIGSAIAEALSDAGAEVILHFHSNEARVNQTADRIRKNGGTVSIVQANISCSDDVETMFHSISDRFRKLDILVNNAGAHVSKEPLDSVSIETIQQVISVNLLGTVYVTKAALRLLRNSGEAAVINISSIAAISGGTIGSGLYAAAKGGMESFTRSMAKELAPTIRVNAVSPAAVPTDFHHGVTSAERWSALKDMVPLKKLGRPEDTAHTVLFLASSASAYISGQVIQVNGARDLNF